MKKMILHIPHSSTHIPFYDGFVEDREKIDNELIKLTDWYTDDLFANGTDDHIITPFSRLFCDVERFTDDDLEPMSRFGMGALYEKFDDGATLRTVTPGLRKRILEDYYQVHHDKLTDLVEEHLEEHNGCLIVDCHSFPEKALKRALDRSTIRPDFNIGTDPFHTPRELVDMAVSFFEESGHSVLVDRPYSGSMVPQAHYRKDKRVGSIMLEINRGLYLDGDKRTEGYERTRTTVQSFLNHIRG
ncbi:N-formylglutamate amidohydrolase [Flagellimonas marinaquae]|uniref:N-formylglutamate amidohydrolase n=1 Tax=Flagellimonas marinaquae TaxID=254955 RepID=UPI000F8C35D4|nr:N-formylglutamate amidohydrolase [Allomuricauda aquimarina]